MLSVEDWAEIRRLHTAEGMAIKAIVRKAESDNIRPNVSALRQVTELEPAEREVIQVLAVYENRIQEAARDYSPAVIANYVYELAREYNQFYQSIPIFSETDAGRLHLRVALSATVARVINQAMGLLGIEVPEKM